MSVQEKCYLHIEAHSQFHRDVRGSTILDIITEVDTISY
jgi:hypothetical protein